MVDKSYILDEIRRTAEANGGEPLGERRFCKESGLRREDFVGKYWARWGDAVREAGFDANARQGRFEDTMFAERLAVLVRRLGHYPVRAEILMEHRRDSAFPHYTTFKTRFSSKAATAAAVIAWCEQRGEFEDVIALCRATAGPAEKPTPAGREPEVALGDVYLIKAGKFFKIGRSNAAGRREREIALQLPEKAARVHTIKTDDPVGIEAYWHGRFADRRKNGEWFELSASDVSAFKRRRFM